MMLGEICKFSARFSRGKLVVFVAVRYQGYGENQWLLVPLNLCAEVN